MTRGDLERLGVAFTRHIPIEENGPFADLLAKLDAIEISAPPHRNGDDIP